MLTNTQQLLKTNRRLHSYSFTRSFAFGEASAVVFTPCSQDLGHITVRSMDRRTGSCTLCTKNFKLQICTPTACSVNVKSSRAVHACLFAAVRKSSRFFSFDVTVSVWLGNLSVGIVLRPTSGRQHQGMDRPGVPQVPEGS